MACASCGRHKTASGSRLRVYTSNEQPYPFTANDIQVLENNEIHRFDTNLDWDESTHKLFVFIPETFTPVCQTELGAMNHWYEEFKKLDCELIAAGSDSIGKFAEWYKEEPALVEPLYKTFSSYLLPSRLGIIESGRTKRASVFVTKDGEVVKQEHFEKVGRSFAELHRMIYAYNTDSYCAEGWKSPEDGFLTRNS